MDNTRSVSNFANNEVRGRRAWDNAESFDLCGDNNPWLDSFDLPGNVPPEFHPLGL